MIRALSAILGTVVSLWPHGAQASPAPLVSDAPGRVAVHREIPWHPITAGDLARVHREVSPYIPLTGCQSRTSPWSMGVRCRATGYWLTLTVNRKTPPPCEAYPAFYGIDCDDTVWTPTRNYDGRTHCQELIGDTTAFWCTGPRGAWTTSS